MSTNVVLRVTKNVSKFENQGHKVCYSRSSWWELATSGTIHYYLSIDTAHLESTLLTPLLSETFSTLVTTFTETYSNQVNENMKRLPVTHYFCVVKSNASTTCEKMFDLEKRVTV